jgi:hypothetical protein
MTFTAVCTIVAFLLLTLSAHAAAAPAADPFLDQHARGVAANKYRGFSVRFTGGRKVFHAGEPIQIELVYEGSAEISSGSDDGPEALWCVRAQFDRPVATPLLVMDSRFDDSIPGGVPGCVSYAPAVRQRTLNGAYRFDTPGHYRMFVESRQVTAEFETSNILEFEILPRDPAREQLIVEDAQRVLASPADRVAMEKAFVALRALATNEAATVLAAHFEVGDDVFEGRSADVVYGLFANPDRAFVVDVLRHELTRPQRPIGWWFVKRLAQLELARRHPAGPPFSHDEYLDISRQLQIARAKALNTVSARLSGELYRELMRFPSSEDHVVSGVTGAAREFPREIIAVFQSLPADVQRSRLVGSWRRFAHPLFLPLVRSLYTSPADGSDEVRDIALRRLYELAPGEGRAAMLAELRRDRLRVSMATLAMLPDRAYRVSSGDGRDS